MRKLGLFKLSLIAILPILLYLGFKQAFDWNFETSTDAHTKARLAFLADLPQSDCLRAEDITPVAQARGWQVTRDPTFDWCIKPNTIESWLRVTIDPPLPFSTDDENSEMFGFDVQGCAVDWEYASGAGSTCPD